jgi:S-formylglutathione hydrolase FrmB
MSRECAEQQGQGTAEIVRASLRVALHVICAAILLSGLAATTCAQTAAHSATNAKQVKLPSDRIQDRVFQSESLSREMHYRILLPANYVGSARSYPVLYLLHGWHGDYKNWTTLTDLTHYAENLPIIIVMPDANDSWYVNSATVQQDKFEQYIIRDLIAEVDQHWRTLRSPHRRAIAGLSMGGYGAVKFALKYPGTFAIAGSISGAFNATESELAASRTDLGPSLDAAFGAPNSTVRAENDVFDAAARAVPATTPYLYLDCGTRDVSFVQSNRKLVSNLSQRNLAYEYHETPGAHTWEYWDMRLPNMLAAVVKKIVPEKSE